MTLLQTATSTQPTTISTIALFAGVIGVALGWLLGELTKLVKWLAQGKERKKAEERSRVLELIHSAELLSTTGNGLGAAVAAAADGKPIDSAQIALLTAQVNEAVIRLNRLRLEVAILGPEWSREQAVKVENAALTLMTAITQAERRKDKPAFAELIKKVGEFRDARSQLVAAATKEYS